MTGQRRPRTALSVSLLGLAVLAVVLAATVSGWSLVVVPLAVVGAYGARLGLSGAEMFDALGAGDDDLGRGPAGLLL